MSRIKLTLLSLAAVLGVIAVASTPALATSEYSYFVEGSELTSEEGIEGSVETVQLNATLAGIKTLLVCTENTFNEGVIGAEGEGRRKFEFKKCKVSEIKSGGLTLLSTCTISEPIAFGVKEQLIEGPGGIGEDEFKPSAGEVLAKIGITGSLCAVKGTLELDGTFVASFGDDGLRALATHVLSWISSGAKLYTQGIGIRNDAALLGHAAQKGISFLRSFFGHHK